MPFLQLRITLDPSANRTKDSVFSLISTFKNSWVPKEPPSEYSCGYEELNKYGEPCDPHIHFNVYFEQPDLKDPLRSAKEFLKRNAIARDFRLKGNKVWSCTLVEHPTDFNRWIRYPLKESPIPQFCSGIDLTELILEARSERKRSIELNILKREKLADKISFRDKLFKHLSESLVEDNGLPDHQDIWIAILNYYQSQGKAICFRTVTGYTVGYQLHINAITPEQAYAMRNNPQ